MSRQRFDELLVARATADLDAREAEELRPLLVEHGDDRTFDVAAAAIHQAFAHAGTEDPLPHALRERLIAAAPGSQSDDSGSTARVLDFATEPTPPAATRTAWWAAAAALVLALAGWWPRLTGPSDTLAVEVPATETLVTERTAAERRVELLQVARTRQIAWTATEDPAAADAEGDVVWNQERGEGYLRIRNLEANDPASQQYQLWVFDRDRDERYPVDGGVFDMPQDGTEAVIPITTPVGVSDAYLFAVTVEPPGGVVVSSRERIVLLAET